ncbi:MAG: glycosyltransferase family 4 protein [Gaiellaceae bacterium]
MKVEIVSGIWPPDVGGPATHAPELAAWLRQRGHAVEALVTAARAPEPQPYPVRWVSRRLPVGVRHAEVVRRLVGRGRRADVVYATSMLGRSAAATALTRTPLVLKVTSDPAFERARRRGAVGGAVLDFQSADGGGLAGALRVARDATVRRAAHVVCPSSFMAALTVSWGLPEERVTVLPNPAPRPSAAAAVELDARPALVFAGRLTPAKDIGMLLRALADVPDATLTIVGDGADRPSLEALASQLRVAPRVRFLGARPRAEVLGLMAAADAVVLTSAWENFPHGLVEALAMGTPVIATRVGGVPEIVADGENGLLVEPGEAHGFAAAVNGFLEDAQLRARLRAAAAGSVARFEQDVVYGRLEQILAEAAA